MLPRFVTEWRYPLLDVRDPHASGDVDEDRNNQIVRVGRRHEYRRPRQKERERGQRQSAQHRQCRSLPCRQRHERTAIRRDRQSDDARRNDDREPPGERSSEVHGRWSLASVGWSFVLSLAARRVQMSRDEGGVPQPPAPAPNELSGLLACQRLEVAVDLLSVLGRRPVIDAGGEPVTGLVGLELLGNR